LGNSPYKIIVDADACPVKAEIIHAAKRFAVQVWMVASFDHRLDAVDGVEIIQVDRSSQSVDIYISNHIGKQDILVTQDFGLAAIGLAKQAVVLSNRGQLFSDRTIDFLLDRRHEQAKQRRSGKHSKGPKAMTDADRQFFLHSLTKVLQSRQEKGETTANK
jgi:uncharacterized protein YaiI (UPF0178 family)